VVRERGRTAEQADLIEAMLLDMRAYAALTGPRRLASVFFGGGTPSLMRPEWVARLLEEAVGLWSAEPDLEVSLEANPTDAEAGRFADLAAAGVGRLSLGVQALDDDALAFLGRTHGAEEARRAVATAAAAFGRVSLDLIYARPGQTSEAWAAELTEAVTLGAEHLSPYQLTIESGTAFDRAVRRGRLTPMEPERAADLYEVTQAVLGAAGYHPYEVSNHARGEAARSRHNLVYWRGQDYVGVGPGAHGRLTLDGVRHATVAPAKVADCIAAAGRPVLEPLSAREALEERVLLGLRIEEGVAIAELEGLDPARAAALTADGLLAGGDRLRATPAGRLVLDSLTSALLV
jgi:oxygen-independent coproporphyrinogen-3 oxidase